MTTADPTEDTAVDADITPKASVKTIAKDVIFFITY